MKKIVLIALTASVLFIFPACKKDCVGGTGGNLTVVAFPKHHGATTQPWYAYIKYDASEYPGPNAADYDEVVAGDTSENHIHLENLKCGDYYIYMIAYDPAIQDTTFGGIPFSTDQKSGEVDLDVPVTE